MGIIWTIIIGFAAGLIAKFIMPGDNEPSGFILTALLGIVGAATSRPKSAHRVIWTRYPKPPRTTEADLQARLEAARPRLHEVVVLRMKSWLPAETLKGLQWAEAFRRQQVRLRYRVLEDLRATAACE
jgi:hypothetical protein